MNIITEKTDRDALLKEYGSYRNVLDGESLSKRPWIWNRLGPLFYECPEGSTVLDVGCNAGDFLEVLQRDRKCKAYGIDVSENCVKEAKNKGLNVDLSDGHKIPFPDSYFDVVFLNEVLIHVFSPKEVLKEIRRVLKPKGFLLGSTPHKNLETKVWEESFSHHPYFDENKVRELILTSFPSVYLKVLNGAQFSFTMAHSIVGDEPAEILFKAGGEDTLPFEEALLDKSKVRVWMGFTAAPGDVYYRMSGYADKMREMGAEIAYESYSPKDLDSTGDWQKRIRFKHVQNQFDAIIKCADFSIWQIVHSMDCIAFLSCIKDLYKKPIITEIDDWLFDIPSSNMASQAYHPNSDKEWIAYKQISLSDGIIVSTPFLKENISDLFPGKPIYIVKNSIDFKIWDHLASIQSIPEKKDGVVRISYNGCGNHDADVEIIKKPLLSLLEEFPNLEIVFPLQFESWKDVNHERVFYINKWFSMDEYPGVVKGWGSDIGLAPLRDNNLNRAKSCLRWLENSALKMPTVMSKVRPFEENVVNGQTGYLCNSKKDWYEKLKYLIENQSERERIGLNSYREVKSNHNMDKVAEGYLELLKVIKKEALR